MLRNNQKEHTLTTYGSLNKSFNNAIVFGKLNSTDIYVLDAMYKLLTRCKESLTTSEIDMLTLLYNDLFYKSMDICKTYPKITISNQSKTSKFQNSSISTNTTPSINYISYWKETDLTIDFEELKVLVQDSNYLTPKSKNTFSNFSKGLNLIFNNFGRICFYLPDNDSFERFKIYDILNNDITEMFDVYSDYDNRYKVIMSKNIYAYGDIYIKIIKQE
jgi:hypothetical protein